MDYTHIADLAKEVTPPEDGVLSRPIYNDDHLKSVVFGFGKGSELSEHTAATPAIVQLVQGEMTLTMGADTIEATPGTWIHMPANLPHSVLAKTPAVLLVMLLK